MKFKLWVGSLAAFVLFLTGIFVELAFSSGVLWGEIETRTYSSSAGGLGLDLNCPLILAFNETGTISTTITNSLNEETLPVVIATFSHNDEPQESSETLTLAPHASQNLQWQVDTSNMIFGRLILVNISQRNYRDLPEREGYCGILLLNILGMSGKLILFLICAISIACITTGSLLWLRIHAPLKQNDAALARPFASLATLATLGLITALIRWWGLIILFDGLVLILIGVICTEVLFNPQPRR